MLKKFIINSAILAVLVSLIVSCEKDPGDGGNNSITGYVHVTDYNATFLIEQGQYPGADEDVYIIYGDDISYGDRIRTGPDGRFEFKYLREGKYTVYVYSEDTTLSGNSVVKVPVEIKGKNKTVDTDTIHIKKN
jgi:hypothetical protein